MHGKFWVGGGGVFMGGLKKNFGQSHRNSKIRLMQKSSKTNSYLFSKSVKRLRFLVLLISRLRPVLDKLRNHTLLADYDKITHYDVIKTHDL